MVTSEVALLTLTLRNAGPCARPSLDEQVFDRSGRQRGVKLQNSLRGPNPSDSIPSLPVTEGSADLGLTVRVIETDDGPQLYVPLVLELLTLS